jgi:hypothetical protein
MCLAFPSPVLASYEALATVASRPSEASPPTVRSCLRRTTKPHTSKMAHYTVDSEYDCQSVIVLVCTLWLCTDRKTHHLRMQVKDTLFTVIRGVFADSIVFQDMFSVPPPADVPVDGSSREHPLKLEGVTKADFKNFQGLFLPTYVICIA